MRRRRFWIAAVLGGSLVAAAFCVYYVKSHPLVFNESLWGHAHCMPQATLALRTYALDHGGQFPYHTNGYGDALLLLKAEQLAEPYCLTGPGYGTAAYIEAIASGRHLDEKRCGRVYVQGLSPTNNPPVVILFDKVAAPPDHCGFPRRLWSGYSRDVGFTDGSWHSVPVKRWPEFVQQQVELLVQAGFTREHAQRLYDEAK
jgi:hypothetical protein